MEYPWEEKGVRKDFTELFWIVSGRLRFRTADRDWWVEADEVFFYRPGEVHAIEVSEGEACRYFWVTFDSPGIFSLLPELGLDDRSFHAGEAPGDLFKRIVDGLEESTPDGEMRSAQVAYVLLTQLSWQRKRLQPATGKASLIKRTIDSEYTDTAFNIDYLSERLRLHRSTVFRIFTTSYGLTPSSYLQRKRLQHGMVMLVQTGRPINEVALSCGYSDANHFAKAVRKSSGFSPSGLRNRSL